MKRVAVGIAGASVRTALERGERDLRVRKRVGTQGDWVMEVEMARRGRKIDMRAEELQTARARVRAISKERREIMVLDMRVFRGFYLGISERGREREILGLGF